MGEKGRGRRAKKAKCEEDVVGGQSRVGLALTVTLPEVESRRIR